MVGVGRPVTEQKDWNGFKFLHKLLRSLSIRVGEGARNQDLLGG